MVWQFSSYSADAVVLNLVLMRVFDREVGWPEC